MSKLSFSSISLRNQEIQISFHDNTGNYYIKGQYLLNINDISLLDLYISQKYHRVKNQQATKVIIIIIHMYCSFIIITL